MDSKNTPSTTESSGTSPDWGSQMQAAFDNLRDAQSELSAAHGALRRHAEGEQRGLDVEELLARLDRAELLLKMAALRCSHAREQQEPCAH